MHALYTERPFKLILTCYMHERVLDNAPPEIYANIVVESQVFMVL